MQLVRKSGLIFSNNQFPSQFLPLSTCKSIIFGTGTCHLFTLHRLCLLPEIFLASFLKKCAYCGFQRSLLLFLRNCSGHFVVFVADFVLRTGTNDTEAERKMTFFLNIELEQVVKDQKRLSIFFLF